MLTTQSRDYTLRSYNITLEEAVVKGASITINTRDPVCHDGFMRQQATHGIAALQKLGILVLYTSNHHRKLAVIDSKILYEGPLNILSQNDSCEIMRKIESAELVQQMIRFTGLERWLV